MNNDKTIQKSNSKGAAIFKKILQDKKVINAHIRKGGKLSDLKDKYNFATPISIKPG